MKRLRIASVSVRGVRGVRDTVKIALGERGLVLRGDNGTGKSSIVEGIRWALLGEMPAAENEDYRTHLRAEGASEVSVELAPRGTIVLRDGTLDDEATTDEGRAFIDHCRRSRPFLRRAELLALLQGEPGQRFQYLAKFFDLAPVDSLERDLEKGLGERRARIEQLENAARRRLETIVEPVSWKGAAPAGVDELERYVLEEAARLGLARGDEGAPLDELAARAAATCGSGSQAARRSELHAAVTEADKMVPPDAPKTALEPLRSAELAATENGLQSLLEGALAHIETRPSRTDCPVCEQAIVSADLVARLKARLALLSDVQQATARVSALAEHWHEFLRALRRLEGVAGYPEPLDQLPRSRDLLERLDRETNLSWDVHGRLERVRTSLRRQHDAIPNDLRASEIERFRRCLERFVTERDGLLANESERVKLVATTGALQAVAVAVAAARKDLSALILEELSDAARAIYERIHGADPDDVTESPRIKFTRQSKGLAKLEGRFAEKSVKEPKLLYSDGHLDTVGIAYFLAMQKLREREDPNGPRILVLDDVVLSVDMTHARALVSVLAERFSDYQVLIATHNQAFAELCKPLHLRRLHIRGWSLEAGPALADHVPGTSRLEHALATTGDVEGLAVVTRPVLEAFFKEASANFGVKLPFEASDLGFADYWDGLRPKLEKLSSTGRIPDVRAILGRLGDPLFLRNALGAHSNDWALVVSLKQAQTEARAALELIDALTCSACAAMVRLPNRRDENSPLACRCPRGAAPTLTVPFATKESA